MRLLFWLFGKRIHRYIAAGLLRPKDFEGMQHAFTDPAGKAYWTWMDITDMAPVRQKHIERCMMMASAGIGEKVLGELCDATEARIMEAVKANKPEERSKVLAKAIQLVGEMRRRPKEVIPEEVWYDLCAVFAIREDENPRSFDPVIHEQKVAMLTKAGRAGHDFFTGLPVLKKVLGSLLTSEAAFTELLSAWAAQRGRLRAVLAVSGN